MKHFGVLLWAMRVSTPLIWDFGMAFGGFIEDTHFLATRYLTSIQHLLQNRVSYCSKVVDRFHAM